MFPMKRSSARLSAAISLLAAAGACANAQDANQAEAAPALPPAVSQVRIVRLSVVQGVVRIDRNMDRGFEPTFVNLPVVQGSKLATAKGLAEVEFEDNSSLRLGPDTEVSFTQLGRSASGSTLNRVELIKGTLYVSLTKDKQNDFELVVGDRKVELPSASHVRLDVYPAGSELAVFKGKVEVVDGAQTIDVTPSRALKFGGPDDAAPKLVRDETPGLYDQWDKTAADYHNLRAAAAFGASPYQYGSQDLSTYGAFTSLDGCGQVWRPYFASAAWNPFGSGVWTYYPGAGYSWVSPYPWGWTPYHSGSWVSCGAAGWGWQPTGGWAGVGNTVLFKKVPGLQQPHPIHGPVPMVAVGMNLLHASQVTPESRVVFEKDSAGLGVPRGTQINLGKASSHVATHGTASAYISTMAPVTVHTGGTSAPTQTGTGLHGQPVGATLASRPVASGGGNSYGGASVGSAPISAGVASGGRSSGVASMSSSSGAASSASAASSAGAGAGASSGGSHH